MNKEFDLVVKGGLLVSSKEIRKADIAISGEVIASVQEEIDERLALEAIDASGKLIFPGILDVHVHPVYLDNIRDTSLAAGHGGTTTLIHFAYARPGERLVDVLERFKEEGSRTSLLDFGLHGGLFEANKQVKEIPKAFELGVKSFKMFMAYRRLGWMTDDYYLMAAMDLIAANGGLVMVHAESGLAIEYLEDKYMAKGGVPADFMKTRPDELESEAIFRAISLASVTGCPLYIPHLSAEAGVDIIGRAKRRGQVIYAESCPQYLSLTSEEVLRRGALAKIGPPLRTDADREALWQGIRTRVIDVIASDHTPKAKDTKADFFTQPFGSPQAETMLTIVYDEGVNLGKIDLCCLVRVLCENPAKIFGLYPQKGTLEVGSDADLVLFDPALSHTITAEKQHTNATYTLYEGRQCLGAPILSMQRGRAILKDGEVKANPGQGGFLSTDPGRFRG